MTETTNTQRFFVAVRAKDHAKDMAPGWLYDATKDLVVYSETQPMESKFLFVVEGLDDTVRLAERLRLAGLHVDKKTFTVCTSVEMGRMVAGLPAGDEEYQDLDEDER
jgi:hypothetical protein